MESLSGRKSQPSVKAALEQAGKDARALVGVIGTRSRVFEVLRGQRPLSLNMIRELHRHFGIPAEVLIQPTKPKPHAA